MINSDKEGFFKKCRIRSLSFYQREKARNDVEHERLF